MDKAQVAALANRQVIYHANVRNADGSALRARVSGQVKEWKDGRWYRPFKHGLRTSFKIGSSEVCTTSERFSNPANWLENDPT